MTAQLITASWNGTTLAESERAVRIEGNWYFPRGDVQMDLLESNPMTSRCWWKGKASWFDVQLADGALPMTAWSYEQPWPLAHRIEGHVAFWGDVEVR